MLQMVKKKFEGDNAVKYKTGDIVDITGWLNGDYLINGGYLMNTDAKEASQITAKVKSTEPPVISAASVSANKQSGNRQKRRSVLTGRKRVFAQAAKQGV